MNTASDRLDAMRVRSLVVLACAATAAGKKKARKAPRRTDDDPCAVCWEVAVHARRTLGFLVRTTAHAPPLETWKAALKVGCPARARKTVRCAAQRPSHPPAPPHPPDLAFPARALAR